MGYPQAQVSSPYYKRNCTWPLARSQNGWSRVTLVARAEAALHHLMVTPRGSYYADPDYGVSLYKFRTQGISISTQAVIMADIRRAAAKYIPDIAIEYADMLMIDSDHRLEVTISWSFRGGVPNWHKELGGSKKLTVSL